MATKRSSRPAARSSRRHGNATPTSAFGQAAFWKLDQELIEMRGKLQALRKQGVKSDITRDDVAPFLVNLSALCTEAERVGKKLGGEF